MANDNKRALEWRNKLASKKTSKKAKTTASSRTSSTSSRADRTATRGSTRSSTAANVALADYSSDEDNGGHQDFANVDVGSRSRKSFGVDIMAFVCIFALTGTAAVLGLWGLGSFSESFSDGGSIGLSGVKAAIGASFFSLAPNGGFNYTRLSLEGLLSNRNRRISEEAVKVEALARNVILQSHLGGHDGDFVNVIRDKVAKELYPLSRKKRKKFNTGAVWTRVVNDLKHDNTIVSERREGMICWMFTQGEVARRRAGFTSPTHI